MLWSSVFRQTELFLLHIILLLQHEQWQRMSEQPGAELIIEYVLYNQTVNYFDSTILIMKSNYTVAR